MFSVPRWTRQQAINYMLNLTAYSEQFIAKEVDRYSTWPGQACSYMYGKLKIWELRKRAVSKLCKFVKCLNCISVAECMYLCPQMSFLSFSAGLFSGMYRTLCLVDLFYRIASLHLALLGQIYSSNFFRLCLSVWIVSSCNIMFVRLCFKT